MRATVPLPQRKGTRSTAGYIGKFQHAVGTPASWGQESSPKSARPTPWTISTDAQPVQNDLAYGQDQPRRSLRMEYGRYGGHGPCTHDCTSAVLDSSLLVVH